LERKTRCLDRGWLCLANVPDIFLGGGGGGVGHYSCCLCSAEVTERANAMRCDVMCLERDSIRQVERFTFGKAKGDRRV
jgi:hypothetical protein